MISKFLNYTEKRLGNFVLITLGILAGLLVLFLMDIITKEAFVSFSSTCSSLVVGLVMLMGYVAYSKIYDKKLVFKTVNDQMGNLKLMAHKSTFRFILGGKPKQFDVELVGVFPSEEYVKYIQDLTLHNLEGIAKSNPELLTSEFVNKQMRGVIKATSCYRVYDSIEEAMEDMQLDPVMYKNTRVNYTEHNLNN